MEIILNNLEETKTFAKELLDMARKAKNKEGATVITLHGDLGAGKTTLVQFLGGLLGVVGQMQSPTFVIQKNYHLEDEDFKGLVHIDAYRIEKPEELKKIKIEETLLKKDTLVIVEWPKQGGEIFKNPSLELYLEFVDENTRKVRIEVK